MKQKRPWHCAECDGGGVVECPHCGNETDCDACASTDLDDSKLDVQAFGKAQDALRAESSCTWEWIVDGVWLGRESNKGRIAYADFQRPAAKG